MDLRYTSIILYMAEKYLKIPIWTPIDGLS